MRKGDMNMSSQIKTTLFSILLISALFFLVSIKPAVGSSSVYVEAVSYQGDIAVNETIVLQATIINTYTTSRIRDIGLVLPNGLTNYSPLVKNINIPGNSFRFVNFTIQIDSVGDFELLFYVLSGTQISDWKTMHLLVESFPATLPPEIQINTTIYINNTIPITINETVIVDNVINNFDTITVFCNDTIYNNITNTILNNIYNLVLINVTLNFNVTQWQQQWQWQNQTVIVNVGNPEQEVLLYTLAGTGILGLFFIGYSGGPLKKKEIFGVPGGPPPKKGSYFSPVIPELEHKFKYGLGLMLAAIVAALTIFLIAPLINASLIVSIVLGFVAASIIFLIIMSLNYPKLLVFTLIPLDIGFWLWSWIPALILLLIMIAMVLIFLGYRYWRSHVGAFSKNSIILR
jgi:hypothetical protein